MVRCLPLALLLTALAAGPAAADEHPLFYLGASAGGHIVLTDIDFGELDIISRPVAIDSSLYAELRLGLDLSPDWSVELAFGYLPFGSTTETNDGLDLAARARWTFADVALRPYLLAGGGVYINPQPDPIGTPTLVAPEGHYGIGLGPHLLDNLRLRVEVRHQLTDGLVDEPGMALVALAGLDFLPGAGDDAPAPPADRDGDGVPDARDACPDVPAPTPDGCPVPEPPADRDGDGVPDARDACPDEPAPTPDGCPAPEPPADRDGDSVPDDRDACPDEPAPTPDGCPPRAPAPMVRLTCEQIEVAEIVLFTTGSYQLTPEAVPLIDEVARTLTEHPELRRVRITGFTDAVGAADDNDRLSLQRAWNVRDALIERGVAKDRLTVAGRGERAPRAPNTTPDGRQQNRRVQFTITAADARVGCPGN